MTRRPRDRIRARSSTRPAARRRKLRYLVGAADQLHPGQSRKFILPIQGADEECFVINNAGQFHAYVNRCRHIPIPMDWVDNQFFTEDCRYLLCQTHGALYEPATGECLAGPTGACGKFLFRVPIEVDGGLLYARPPEGEIEPGI
jgi:nitrite reductase/ring-hydroxylating ferredoxin subunit